MCRGAMQFLLCRNVTARYFSPVELLKNITQCHPKIIWHQGYGNHSIILPRGLLRAPAPTISKFLQVLRTGERCSPLQIIRAGLLCRKIATLGALFLPHACVQLWSAMPIPHSSFLTPHLASPCILSTHICIY